MTICIAAICRRGKAVVFATDRMVSALFLDLEFEHPNSKIQQLTGSCIGLTAGDALADIELFRSSMRTVEQLQAPAIDTIACRVADQFMELRNARAEALHLRPRGMTLDAFYKGALIRQLPEGVAYPLDNAIQEAAFPLEIIIAGVDDTGAHIYGIHNPGVQECYDRLSYHAIGSGQRHALLSIIGNEHSSGRSLNETLWVVYEAKKRAELAQGVGEATEIGFVAEGQDPHFLTEDETNLLHEVGETKKAAPQLDEVKKAIQQLPFGGGGEDEAL